MADVGIAIGGLGADAAIAWATLVGESAIATKVAQAIQIARKTRRIFWQNIGFAVALKILWILLVIFSSFFSFLPDRHLTRVIRVVLA